MAVNRPPIQEKVQNNLGFFPQVWIRWLNDLMLKFNSRMTWWDISDLTTQSTPIAHIGGNTTNITNDGVGAYSTEYNFNNEPTIWDSSTNSFDFSNFKIGDIVTVRFDFIVETTANNQEIDFLIDFAIGSSSNFTHNISHVHYKAIGTYPNVFIYLFYIGSDDIKNYPCKVKFQSADDANITVNGWLVKKWAV